ncbi:MAG: cysteine desulfurase NifS [Deltaproteobacteria bacterium]|nr:cysteine desulfurase NifS [Pseudomonadota bacterium]MCK5009600.1 cysteine desulfurase NifS [Deltaproteobacteria bacterium]MCK5187340.1 cysteine desulfurase NifS [Deltaproteobacteria bacterium]MCK5422855.1 cysteine desulfurase NifS [Deltaproteobacteria bacterium]
MRNVYADNNATTRVAPEVVEEMLPYFSELYGNPSSMHYFGGQVEKKLIEAREKVASLLNCDPSEIIFTSCGTESDSTAIQGTVESYPYKKHIITTRVEHPAVLNLCRHLSKNGYKLTELAVDKKGCLDLSELENAIVDNTAIVSIMCANNETGVIFPIEEIGEIVKSKGAVFHCDAVQATGKIPLDMSKCAIDLLSLSGHKLHAPKGIGALYIRKGAKLTPFIIGGHQERGRRAGTENVPYIIGLGKASELALKHIEDGNTRIKALRDRLEKELLRKCTNTRTNGDTEHRLPNTTNISFEFVEGEAILLMLSQKGIAASSGSACTSGSLEPSHVLRAMGIPFTFVHGSLRLSLSRYNNEEDIDYIIEHLPPIIERLREISPFGKD